jgi:hypothetical protein
VEPQIFSLSGLSSTARFTIIKIHQDKTYRAALRGGHRLAEHIVSRHPERQPQA